MAEISKETIKAYALENAIKYKGSANQGAVLSSLFAEGLEKSEIKNYMPKIQEVLKEVNSMSLEDQEKALEKLGDITSKRVIREGLPELPNGKKGEVVMRMAPFPSGPLHIGNARALILNDEYCKMYNGKFILFFDDTIGSEQKQIEPEAYKLIEEGVKSLGIKPDKIYYKSDLTKEYYKYAEELIEKGHLYVCDCDNEEWKKLKDEKKECPCRKLEPKEQMARWKKMFEAKQGSMAVRLKTSMSDPDPAFRDRVMFKISDRPHPRTGTKFRVYPSMEFSWAIDDTDIGTTHVLRGTEHFMSTRVQDFIRNLFGWQNPESIYNGLLEIEGVKISKSKSTAEVKSGEYTGWNDPRTWSLQSLQDRGINPEAIREFIINAGIRRNNVTVPIEVLYNLNKKILDENPRYFFVENPQEIEIENAPEINAEIPLHPNGKLGVKKYKTGNEFLIAESDFKDMKDGKYRLMHLLTFESQKGKLEFTSTEPDTDKKTKFIHWIPKSDENIETEILMPNGEIKKGLTEPLAKKLKVGDIIQLERFGFVKLHNKEKGKLEFWFAHK